MKLQNLIIIFIIIIIPIVAIFSLYLNLETKTITLQTDYDEKLIEATKEAMEAFEINTVEWNSKYSTLANSKRQDLMSVTNVFTSSLADKLRIGGSSKETILNYVPAIVFIMYDGYYIYSPTYVPKTVTNNKGVQLFYYDSSGSNATKITASATQNIGGINYAGAPIYVAKSGEGTNATYNGENIYYTTDITKAEKTYKHVLKTFVPYTANYTFNDKKYVVNYTLDNYIRIYGENNEDIAYEGYILEDFSKRRILYSANSPTIYEKFLHGDTNSIEPESLTENISVRNTVNEDIQIKKYAYIYNTNNDKRYYDTDKNKFFTVDKNYVKVYLPNAEVGSSLAEYKKAVTSPTTMYDTNYVEFYQVLNPKNDGSIDNKWYIFKDNKYVEEHVMSNISEIKRDQDCSAMSYYAETYKFNKLIRSSSGLGLKDEDIETILNGKNQAIIENINNNLNLTMSNYSANSKIDYQLPEITDKDWEQALSNISIITFFQGKNIGLKNYNNYAIVTSTHNNEYVNEDSLYYLGNNLDQYYHRYNCSDIQQKASIGYINTEFKPQRYSYRNKDGNTIEGYYYKHIQNSSGNIYNQSECFNCIVNRNTMNIDTQDKYKEVQEHALARERYIQMQKTKLTKN